MSLDVSPTAIADIRKGVGPAGREPQTVMEVRDSSFQSRSVAHLFPIPIRLDTPRERANNALPRAGPSPRRVAPR